MGKAVKKKGDLVFTFSHASMYGLKIMNKCADTKEVVSIRCQFCIYFGVEIGFLSTEIDSVDSSANESRTVHFLIRGLSLHYDCRPQSTAVAKSSISVVLKLKSCRVALIGCSI